MDAKYLIFKMLRYTFITLAVFGTAQVNGGVVNHLPLQDVKQVVAGSRITCALTNAGSVLCWGSNYFGAIGDGTYIDRATPTPVLGLHGGVSKITTTPGGNCALKALGSVMCWGNNVTAPAIVSGLEIGIVDISGNCALTNQGAVLCNRNNEVTLIAGLETNVVQVSAVTNSHHCALKNTGEVLCWGRNSVGQRGDGTIGNNIWSNTLSTVINLPSNIRQIQAHNNRSCALTNTGELYCWGYKFPGQIPEGSPIWNLAPVLVQGLGNVQDVIVGDGNACAINAQEQIYCWGENYSGILAHPGITQTAPLLMNILGTSVAELVLGAYHACALQDNEQVQCWGGNTDGQLGDGTFARSWLPTLATAVTTPVIHVAAGAAHTCAVTDLGAVICWGANSVGQLGDGSKNRSPLPVAVAGLSNGVTALSAGYTHNCALNNLAEVHCWGTNQAGQLGNGNTIDQLTPVRVLGLPSDVVSLTAGHTHTCALTNTGAAYCWGSGEGGALGNGALVNSSVPVAVSDPTGSGFISISASGEINGAQSCAVSTVRTVYCWGYNRFNRLGVTSHLNYVPIPTLVTSISGEWDKVSVSSEQICALSISGLVRCWGYYNWAQIESDALSFSTGYRSGCAIFAAGNLQCWGYNRGDGTNEIGGRVPVVSLLGQVTQVVKSQGLNPNHSCALLHTGQLQCWGNNGTGELGIGGRRHYEPALVVIDQDNIFGNSFE